MIIHLDLDAFFCSVEELRDPSLIGKPFAVGGRPEDRGVVASCSYAARRCGVHSAMPMARALRICPGLIIIRSHHSEYSKISDSIMSLLRSVTPLIEQVSIDEAFLDISSLTKPPIQIARDLQVQIWQEFQLPCSFGVAANKLMAKIANDVGKSSSKGDRPPNAVTIVEPGDEAAFLAELPVDRLWGVGPKTAARLKSLGIEKIGELASYPENELVRIFGKNGYALSQHAKGIDHDPILTSHEMKSISQEITFSKDVREKEKLINTLKTLSDQVAERLQAEDLTCSTVKIKVRWPDFTTISRQKKLTVITDKNDEIFQAALQLFHKVLIDGKAVRLIGVGVSGFQHSAQQLQLWGESSSGQSKQKDELMVVMEYLQKRYGKQVIQRGLKPK
jgi:DNA polymerase-4